MYVKECGPAATYVRVIRSTEEVTMTIMLMTVFSALAGLTAMTLALLLRPSVASAHCDTMDGPAVKDGQLALQTGNVNIALKWVHEDGGAELARIFAQAEAARGCSEAARVVADQWFLENLVRIHRAGEGAPYTGLQPVGAPVDERVRAADEAVASGTLAPLAGMVPEEQVAELEQRFAAVLARKDFTVDDVDAGRSYLDAYVRFFKLAEGHGEEHDHANHHEHQHV
jgi:hypothetical protein